MLHDYNANKKFGMGWGWEILLNAVLAIIYGFQLSKDPSPLLE